MAGIYKSYDIRGIYPDDLDESIARDIGVAAGNFYPRGTVVVGHDMREVAVPISEALVEGLRATGQDGPVLGSLERSVQDADEPEASLLALEGAWEAWRREQPPRAVLTWHAVCCISPTCSCLTSPLPDSTPWRAAPSGKR